METVGEFYDENANVVSGCNHETEEVVFCFGEVSIEILHVFADATEFCDAINEKSNRISELFFDVFELYVGIFDGIMKDAGDNCVFVHAPFFKNFLYGERMDNIRFAGTTKLAFMGFCGHVYGALNTFRIFMFLVHYVKIIP